MSGMSANYASRAFISIAFGALFILSGAAWWVGVMLGALAFGFLPVGAAQRALFGGIPSGALQPSSAMSRPGW